jgi:CDP-diacylglycerol--serine O-phosphatidyltransferase
LVDAISFGVAPGIIMYEIFFHDTTSWSWTLSYVFIVASVVRLARFNVEQGGEAKRHFLGLPSPAAGMTLASWYPFSQTPLFNTYLSDLPWPQIMAIGMVLVGILMVSHVPYAKVPRLGLRTTKGRLTTAWIGTLVVLAITVPHYYFFIAGVLYILIGLLKTVFLGLLERLPDRDPLFDEHDDDDHEYDHSRDTRALDYSDLNPEPRRSPAKPPENDS